MKENKLERLMSILYASSMAVIVVFCIIFFFRLIIQIVAGIA